MDDKTQPGKKAQDSCAVREDEAEGDNKEDGELILQSDCEL